GTYPINASGAVDANYSISYVAGTLTVTQAGLTITANNQTRVYGASNPTLTVSYTGLVNGDTNTSLTTPPTITTAALSVGVGAYPINASGAVDANYSISYVAGTLTVTQAGLTITANNQTKAFGTAQNLGTTAFTAAGLFNNDAVSGVTLTSTGAVSTALAGTYTIVPSAAVGTGLSNYHISY